MIYKLSTLIFVSISYHFSCKLVILASILRFGSTLIFISVKYPKISYVTAEISRPIVNEKIYLDQKGIGAILTIYCLLLQLLLS